MEVSCDFMTQWLNNIPNFLHEFRKWYENRNIRQEDNFPLCKPYL